MDRKFDFKDYIRQQYDNQVTSDIIIQDNIGGCIYAHTFVLRSVEYFSSLLNSMVGSSNKKSIQVESTEIARPLIGYIYYKSISLPQNLELKKFIDLVNLSKEWLLFNDIKYSLFNFAIRYKDTTDISQIYYIADLYLHFNDQGPEITQLFEPIIKHFRKNYDELPSDILDYEFFDKMFNNSTKIAIITKNGDIKRLNDKTNIKVLDSLPQWIVQYYENIIEHFDEHQIKLIRQATTVTRNKWNGICSHEEGIYKCEKCVDVLCIESFLPFKYTFYKYVGSICKRFGKLKFYPARRSLSCGDKILTEISETAVKNMSTIMDDKEIKKSVPYNIYNIELSDVFNVEPEKEFCVWKIKTSTIISPVIRDSTKN